MEDGFPLFCGEKARYIIPNIDALLKKELDKGSKLFFICDNHEPDDLEFKMFPPHCIAGTREAEIIPELSSYPGEIIPKTRFSGFFKTNLDEKLQKLKPKTIIICGVCTDICILHTVADARNRNYKVYVPINCVASFNDYGHRFALDHMEKVLGAKLIK